MKLNKNQERELLVAIEKCWEIICLDADFDEPIEPTTVVEWSIINDRLLTNGKSQEANDIAKQMVESMGWHQACKAIARLIVQGD